MSDVASFLSNTCFFRYMIFGEGFYARRLFLLCALNRTEKSGHGILLFLWLWVGFRFGKRLLGCPPWGAKIFFHLNRVFVAQGGMLAKAVVE